MRHLHIVMPYDSVAMHRLADPLLHNDRLKEIYTITVGKVPDPLADVNYHIPWHTMVGLNMPDSRHVILYTHCNVGDEERLYDACARADRVVCMSFQGRKELLEYGVDRKKIWVIYAPAGDIQLKRKNVGVIGFQQPNGRKRFHLLLDLAWHMDQKAFAMLNFVVVGGGLQDLCQELKNANGSVEYYENLSSEQMTEMYSHLDLLLVTGYAEGGPLPVLEAMSAGVPVLAPPVGYAADFLSSGSLYHTQEELEDKLRRFVLPALNNFYMSRILSKALYVREHAVLFGELLCETAEVELGVDRYRNLLNIIEDNKITDIVEIGTWNGERAVQMIQQALRFSADDKIHYTGYDLFEEQTTKLMLEEYSKESGPEVVVDQRLRATPADIELIKGNTRSTLKFPAPVAQLYFIDGGHSLETIASDWSQIQSRLDKDSIVVFDDYYVPEMSGFGCNQIVDQLDPTLYKVEFSGLSTKAKEHEIKMVEVRPYANIRLHLSEQAPGRDDALDAMRYGLQLSDMRTDYAPSAPSRTGQLGWLASAFRALTWPSRKKPS